MIFDFIDLLIPPLGVSLDLKYALGFIILYTIFIGIIEIFQLPFKFF